VSWRIAKSSRMTSGRINSRIRLSQVRSAWPPARSARIRLVLAKQTFTPWRTARWPRAWATCVLPTPTGPNRMTDSPAWSQRRAARSRIWAAGSFGEAAKSNSSSVTCCSNFAWKAIFSGG
jgi:transposase